jgi:hypothetical protein
MTEERSRRVVGERRSGMECSFKGKWKVGEWKEAVVSCQNAKEFDSIIFHNLVPRWRKNPWN